MQRSHFAADHELHEFVSVEAGGVPRGHEPTTLQDAHAVGDGEHFVEIVRHVQDAHPAALNLPEDVEEAADLSLGQCHGRLVENQRTAPGLESLEGPGDGYGGALHAV